MTRDNDWSHRRDLSRRPLKRWQRRWKDGWTHDLEAPGARRNAHIDMWVFDHGLLRLGWRNLHEVAPGVWRGNQPGPRQIRRMAEHGLRSILNLRGATEFGSYLLERETCTAVGVRLYDLKSSSRHPPSREWIDRLNEYDVPHAPVMTRSEMIRHPQIQANKLIVQHDHPEAGPLRQTRTPARFGGTPAEYRMGGPRLGQHTSQVLSEAGFSDAEIAALLEDGAAITAK